MDDKENLTKVGALTPSHEALTEAFARGTKKAIKEKEEFDLTKCPACQGKGCYSFTKPDHKGFVSSLSCKYCHGKGRVKEVVSPAPFPYCGE
jgi:DnaJ-class molecular chaperone